MPPKRGRPLSGNSHNTAADRRRHLTRERTRQWRIRQRNRPTDPTQLSRQQLAQGEQIINFTTLEEESAAATLLELGLRVQDCTLPQDPRSAQLESSTVNVNIQGLIKHHQHEQSSGPAVVDLTEPSPQIQAQPSASPVSSPDSFLLDTSDYEPDCSPLLGNNSSYTL
jgi:hypothetical protein